MTNRELVLALRRRGFSYQAIADGLGLSLGRAKRLGVSEEGYQRDLRGAREFKARRRGVCEECGGETRYNGHGTVVSRTCKDCANLHAGDRNKALRGTTGLPAAALAYMTVPRRFMEVRAHLGLDSNNTSGVLNRLDKYGLVDRPARGLWVAK